MRNSPFVAYMPTKATSPAARYNALLRRLGILDRTVSEDTARRVDAELAQLAAERQGQAPAGKGRML
jgi:hypothetical protein